MEKSGEILSFKKTVNGAPLYSWSDLQKFPEIRKMSESNWESECKTHPVRKFRSIELFAGAGGLVLGLEKAGFEAVALNESGHDACETLRTNRPRWHVIEEDVAKIDFSRFKDIDLVSGGFPCQAFSYAGKRLGLEDIRGTLFFDFARVIRETQPKIFLGENVRGLLTHDGGKTIEVIKSVIKEIGYTLVEPRVLKAIGYKAGKNHPAKQQYILYKLLPSSLALPCAEISAIPIVGKGIDRLREKHVPELVSKTALKQTR